MQGVTARGELAKLAEIYEAKGLDAQLAQLTFLIMLVALVLLGAATMVIGVLIGKAVGL